MLAGLNLKIEGPISARLLKNIGTIQHIFHEWDNRFNKITVAATPKAADAWSEKRLIGCFFSAGVDSLYTLLKNYAEIDILIYLENPFLDEAGKARTNNRIREAARQRKGYGE